MIHSIENMVFKWKGSILAVFLLITVISLYWALQLKPDAGFEKQLPLEHEYVKTHYDHIKTLGSGNRILVAVEAKQGTVWTEPFLRHLKKVNDAIFYMPGIHKGSVSSLWTPNSRFIEIDEKGIHAENLIPGTITENELTPEVIESIRAKVVQGGFSGQLVANDFRSALITANVMDYDYRTQEKLDLLDVARKLETEIRGVYQTDDYAIRIVGLTKMFGDVADSATAVVQFFAIAFVLTALSVYLYSRSFILTALPLLCSLASLIWQFALLKIMGFGIDPLAILVPFLVFAIGVSHGIQQINLISKRVAEGATGEEAARSSFSELLIPGSMALITDLVGFGTLWLVPIGMIQEMAITATIGVGLKIITNLFMLPLAASYFRFSTAYKEKIQRSREIRTRAILYLRLVTQPKITAFILVAAAVTFAYHVYTAQDRIIGDVHAGSPLLKEDHRYNIDSRFITENYSFGFDLLVILNETPPQACIDYDVMRFVDNLAWHMENVPGVTSVYSAPYVVKRTLAAFMEGNPKFQELSRNRQTLVLGNIVLAPSTGLIDEECKLLNVAVFLEDAKATTISRVLDAAKSFRERNELILRYHADLDRWVPLSEQDIRDLPVSIAERISNGSYIVFGPDGSPRTVKELDDTPKDGTLKNVNIRLASGNAGLFGAINEEIEESETPMLVLVYLVILSLVFATYRDWRAAICCCLPLTLATFAGYWFMDLLEIGLKVSTLPVMILAVGIGVDYAFYIYNRLQVHLGEGLPIDKAYALTLTETGIAVMFTAVTLALGVFTWIFSDLKFQADMGALLTFMFLLNASGALIVLPALANALDRVFPRHHPPAIPPQG